MSAGDWKGAGQVFFDQRARALRAAPSLAALAFASGRDTRIWADPLVYEDLMNSILEQTETGAGASLLEVGSACGYLAYGLAPRVGEYVGVDLSGEAVASAGRLDLPNASFQQVDGAELPFDDGRFDAALCYDVVTNLPGFADVATLMDQMLRAVRPGGIVLVGSVPDAALEQEFLGAGVRVDAELEARGLDRWHPDAARPWWRRLLPASLNEPYADQGAIVCYYFTREDFEDYAAGRGCAFALREVHPANPYAAYRFNAQLRRPG